MTAPSSTGRESAGRTREVDVLSGNAGGWTVVIATSGSRPPGAADRTWPCCRSSHRLVGHSGRAARQDGFLEADGVGSPPIAPWQRTDALLGAGADSVDRRERRTP